MGGSAGVHVETESLQASETEYKQGERTLQQVPPTVYSVERPCQALA